MGSLMLIMYVLMLIAGAGLYALPFFNHKVIQVRVGVVLVALGRVLFATGLVGVLCSYLRGSYA